MGKIQKRKKEEQALQKRALKMIYHSLDKHTYLMSQEAEQNGLLREMEEILHYYNRKLPPIPVEVTEPQEQLDAVLAGSGLLMRKITLTGEWWTQAALPMLIFGPEGEPQAVLPEYADGYSIYIENEKRRFTKEDAENYGKTAFCFYRTLQGEKTGMKNFALFLLKSLTPVDFILVFSISLLLELAGLILPYINSIVYEQVIPSGTAGEIPGIMVLIFSSIVFSTLIALTRTLWVTRIGNKITIAGQSAIWDKLFHLPVSFFQKYEAGELYLRANSVNRICRVLGGELIPALLTSFLSVIYLFQISAFAKELVVPSVLIITLLLINTWVMCYFQIQHQKKQNEAESRTTGMMYQLFNGISKIRLAGAEVRAFYRWADSYKEKPAMPNRYLQIFPIISTAISSCGTIWLYVTAYRSGLSASMYIAFQTAFSAFLMAVMALANLGHQLGGLKPAIDMIRPILEEVPENEGIKEQVKNLQGNIEVSNVKFRYREDMPYVINQLNLEIQAGEYLGIVGSSGCGKSTLMRLLLGFEKAESGTIYYDKKDIKGLDLPSLRRRIGVVLQNGKLFSGDIYSNIAICAPWLTMDEAWDAAERAGLAEDIEHMPMGMFTMLSEDGGGLSGGQKQRLLIARALAANPAILLFDEATSALDNITQAIIVDTLKNMKCTRLVIAHRLSTIKDCDRIIYLEKGRIVEEGTYEELMALGGRFKNMAIRQLV